MSAATATTTRTAPAAGQATRRSLMVAALGVVFGDIGTSPLYTLKTCFSTAHVPATLANVLGIVSLLIWTLLFVVCVKYVGTLLRVDHQGEGGILALLALASPKKALIIPVKAGWLTLVVVAGASMLVGDGIITPAISVLSAVEGVGVATKAAQPFVVPLSVAILVALFAIQSRGTERVGRLFGPAMLVWFLTIAATGVAAIVRVPSVLAALNPLYAASFVVHHGVFGFLVFGAIVLAVTGVEALYADLSHFGRKPIAQAWYFLVFPALILNYLGQGAALATSPRAFASPFYALTPGWLLIPMVVLATFATVIASQALISGAFTLAEQAINLNLWPRVTVRHTSHRQQGQVYVPVVNATLAIACVVIVVAFGSSDRLAAAYGLAVSTTMLATSITFYAVVTRVLHWHHRTVIPLVAAFLLVDGTFFAASLPKIADGAWIPLAISALIAATALTWLEGRRCVGKSLLELQMPLERYLSEARPTAGEPQGTLVFLTGNPNGIPFIGFKHTWLRARANEQRVVLLTLNRDPRPTLPEAERVAVERVSPRFSIVTANFGFMERPEIAAVLRACAVTGLQIDSDETSFFYADPKIVRANENPMWEPQRRFFEILARNARPLPDDLGIRPERRVELGVEVAI
jgi:KUP system potassium uptake protein